MPLGIEQIKAILPQREPFLFIDEVIEIEGANRIVAVKNISGTEEFFKGHFPEKPVMPGVLIVEALAQASIILYSFCKPEIARKKPDYYLGKVKAEFLSPVLPGDKLIMEINKVKITDEAGIVDALATVDTKIVAKATLIFGIKKSEE
ncbi:MAG TPA: 3-hydroxyacyl-ACP dehydratase FabZ [Nitrospirae bacterium]|nr:3-hydroxyacyl-[acyl-carrier-protein] dehydratase FabZ [bacterium BMS3Abin15]HDO25334.1 3-hydroxyacyl-ACP dehydratase FabZ [Nitrospirota bacterium]